METSTRDQLNTAADAFFAKLAREIDQPREFHPTSRGEEIALNIELSNDDIQRLSVQLQEGQFDKRVAVAASKIVQYAGLMYETVPVENRSVPKLEQA